MIRKTVKVAAALLMSLCVAPFAAAQVKIAVSHTASLESPWNKGAVAIADMINKEAKGKYKVDVFGNGVLNQKNWRVMFEQTQAGSNTIAIESVTALASIVPELGGINLPFLFQDVDHLNRFLQANPAILHGAGHQDRRKSEGGAAPARTGFS